MAWGEDSFGVVWGDARSGNFDIYFRRFDQNGVAMTAEIPLTSDAASSEQADIVAIPDGWLIVLADTASSDLIYGVRIDLDGAITKPKTLIGMQGTKNAVPRAALLGSDVGLLYSKLGSTTAQYRVAFLSASFDFGVSQPAVDVSKVAAPNTGGIMGDIAPNGGDDGFLFAHYNYQNAPFLEAGQLNQAGAVSCSVPVGTAAMLGAAGDVVKVAGGGAFLFAIDAGATAKIHLGAFSTNCLAQASTQLDTAATLGINPNFGGLASGEKGLAIVWEDVLQDSIRIRVTGPNLCD